MADEKHFAGPDGGTVRDLNVGAVAAFQVFDENPIFIDAKT